MSSDIVRALETESDAELRQRHGDELPALILAALRAGSFSSFERGFELAARCCTPATVSEAVAWAERYIASGRGVPDAVPWWDVATRQWLVKLAAVAPAAVRDCSASLPRPYQRLAEFCLALVEKRPLPDDIGEAVARHFLNAGPGAFAYEGLVELREVAVHAQRLLERSAFPILRRDRLEALLPCASDALALELAVNYCGQDFRSFGHALLAERPAVSVTMLESRAARECTSEGKIVLGLQYALRTGKRSSELPSWASAALLLDLCSGSSEDVPETLAALLAMEASQARALVTRALQEQRAVLMVPALADDELLQQFMARIEEGGVDRQTAVAALKRCGAEALDALLNLTSVKRPSASLALVVAEALGELLKENNGVDAARRERGATLLVPWLAHSSKAVTLAVRRTLEQLGDAATASLEVGLSHERKAVRTESSRMLERVKAHAPAMATPLDAVRERALECGEAGAQFLNRCQELVQDAERWPFVLLPQIRVHGALCLEWLRPWFTQHVQHGDVRLWCYVVEQLTDDEEAAWVAVDTFAGMTKLPTSLWARPRRALNKLGASLAKPVAFVLAQGQTLYREPLYRLLAEHEDHAPPSLLLLGLSDEAKAIRSHAVDALSRLSPSTTSQSKPLLGEVLALLSSENAGTRMAVAELLAVWGEPAARQVLSEVYETERRAAVRVYLEEALVAVGAFHVLLPDAKPGTAVCSAAVTHFLEARAGQAKLPRFLLLSPPPNLRFKDGSSLSEAAQLGLLALTAQLDATLKGRLLRYLAAGLQPDSLACWSRHVYERWLRSKDIKFKWALYQLWLFADETLIQEVGAEVGKLRGGEHATISCYLRVLQWRASQTALDWLVHWGNALPSRGLRELARTLLARVARRAGVEVGSMTEAADVWIAARTFEREASTAPSDARAQERWIRHLDYCLLCERVWSADEWQSVVRERPELWRGLLWITHEQPLSTPHCVMFDGQQLVQQSGAVTSLQDSQVLRLAHPLDFDSEDGQRWASLLANRCGPGAVDQVNRPVFIYGGELDLTLAELNTDSERFDAWLRKHRWFHGEPLDHGIVYSNSLRVAAQRLVLRLEHTGYTIGRRDGIDAIEVRALEAFDLSGAGVDLADVPARTYSELCLSLSHLRPPSD